MPVERTPGGTSLNDVLDRVLDKGIVVDPWLRTSLIGIQLLDEEGRLVIASTDIHLRYSDAADRRARSGSDTFGSYASSESALKRSDDDDDDDEGGGGGSSGAPAVLFKPLTPRRRPESRPPRTRRS